MKTITINEEEFMDKAAKAISQYVSAVPEAILIADDLIMVSSVIAKNLFDEKKGGTVYEFRNRNN